MLEVISGPNTGRCEAKSLHGGLASASNNYLPRMLGRCDFPVGLQKLLEHSLNFVIDQAAKAGNLLD